MRSIPKRSRGAAPGLAGLLAVVVLVAGCAGGHGDGRTADGRERVVAAFAPLAEAVARVGGDRVAVTDLTPPGTEPHDLELTSRDVDRIQDAALAVVLGGGFQPAIEDAARTRRDGPTLDVLASMPSETGARDAKDPHVWLDPRLMAAVVTLVEQRLTRVDPAGRATYAARADRYRAALAALDREYADGLADCARRDLVTSHEAFGWLARRYGLRVESIAGLSPDQEPDPRRLAQLADLVRRRDVRVIFTEEQVSPRVARALARETGVRTAVLSPIESLTDAQRARGDDYLSLMRTNLARLRAGLGCVSR